MKNRKTYEKLLKTTAVELSEAKRVLRSEKTEARKFKGSKLEKDNKKRAVQSVTLGVEAVQNRHDTAEEQIEKKALASRRGVKRK